MHKTNTSVKAGMKGADNAFMIRLTSVLENRLSHTGLKAEDVCTIMGVGRTSLYVKLKALTGLSFNVYLRGLRLNEATHLLKDSPKNISEIAYEVGFNDPKYFSRVFTETFGIPPTKFRSLATAEPL